MQGYEFELYIFLWSSHGHTYVKLKSKFLAHQITQMCYCCQKLENLNIFNGINGIGLKCIENRPQMYRESASNVQNSIHLRQR